MDEIKLNYLKDSEGNYIIKQKINDSSYNDRHLITTGTYSENLIISNKYFEKKLEHKLEDIINNLELQIETLKAYKKSYLCEIVTQGLNSNVPTKESHIENRIMLYGVFDHSILSH